VSKKIKDILSYDVNLDRRELTSYPVSLTMSELKMMDLNFFSFFLFSFIFIFLKSVLFGLMVRIGVTLQSHNHKKYYKRFQNE